MECWRLLVVAVVAVGAAAVPAEPGAAGHQKICELVDTCKCSANVISCACSGARQDLVVNADSFPVPSWETLTKFEVKDCSSLTLDEHSLKSASKLQLVHISNVKNVSLGPGVFGNLRDLMVNIVSELILHKGAFEGVQGLNNIVITKTRIPELSKGILYNITNLQEFKLNGVNISKIEEKAVLIDMKQFGSKAEILNCMIGSIEDRGLQIGNGTSIMVQGTEILKAVRNSIRLGALQSVSMKGNKFYPGVDVEAANIIVKERIDFSRNTLLNVDLSNAANIAKKPENETIFSLNRLVTLYGGNYLNCKCIGPASNASVDLKENSCVNGCTESTVAKFLESCQKDTTLSVEDRLIVLCRNTVDNMTTSTPATGSTAARSQKPGNTTPKPKNGCGRISVYGIMPVAFFLFHFLL